MIACQGGLPAKTALVARTGEQRGEHDELDFLFWGASDCTSLSGAIFPDVAAFY
ncbi:hypothetical protein [Breoghania corrubedonensis]|uniref:hypothetical protein n=1 Tax=Breoghania corrubedonensis TaxID=665038 RepID=UPI00147595B5|nr:hypothetical protein [Breoghania corrubedonensis]